MQRAERKIYSVFVCTNAMDAALDGPFRFECGPDVERVRQCCYRIRMRHRARGDTRYDGVRFRIVNGTELEIWNSGRAIDIAAEKMLNDVTERWERDRRHNDSG